MVSNETAEELMLRIDAAVSLLNTGKEKVVLSKGQALSIAIVLMSARMIIDQRVVGEEAKKPIQTG